MSFSDLVDKKLNEKAESKSQRRLMGWAKACDEGETDCPEHVRDVAKSFKDKAELKKFAKTKHKGLPEKVAEGFGRFASDEDDDRGDWEHERRRDKELDRRGEQQPEQDLEEGPAYGAEKWDDYEGDQDTEEEMQAWTGGSGPPAYKEMDIRTQKLVRRAYQQQLGEYTSGWGDEPDDDTKQIFWNRAMHDAWATTRRTAEDITWADLDSENILGENQYIQPGEVDLDYDATVDRFLFHIEGGAALARKERIPFKDAVSRATGKSYEEVMGLLSQIAKKYGGEVGEKARFFAHMLTEAELATATASPGPDKDGTPHFEKQPADAGKPEWHEPKPDYDTIEHRSNLRGVIQAGVNSDMANKAYKGGSQNKPKYSKKPYKETIRVNHPVKGDGTVVSMNEGRVVIEWDSLNLRPLGPETLTKAEARFVTITERYSGDPVDAEMGPKSKKKKKKKDKEEVEEGDVVQMGGEAAPDELSPQMITVLRNSYGGLDKINPESHSYAGLIRLLDKAEPKLLKQLAGADIKFVSMLARNRLMKQGISEDQYEQQPSFQVAPPPSMTIFQDQETDEDWNADPLSTQRGAEAAGRGDAPEGEMEEPDDAPDDLNIDHQDLPDSGRAEQIAGEVFSAFDGEGGSNNEIDYKSDQVDFAKQNDNSHNKEGGEAPQQNDERDDSEGEESEPKKEFPARDKGSDEGESEDKGKDPREPKEDKEPESKDDKPEPKDDESEDEDKKEKADESLRLSDFDIEGILD